MVANHIIQTHVHLKKLKHIPTHKRQPLPIFSVNSSGSLSPRLPFVFDFPLHECGPQSYVPGKVSEVCPAPEKQSARVP